MMEFERIVAPSPKELFIEQIVTMIISGRLKPGEKLPTEREIAEQMGINRSLVHNGMEELQRMGFVRIENRRGAFIRDYASDGNFNTLVAIARYNGSEYDDKTRISMVEARNAIVGGSMIRIAKTGTPEDFRYLRSLVKEHRENAGDDTGKAASFMKIFNLTLVRMSGNTIFPLIMNTFADHVPFWNNCVNHWGIDTIFDQEEHMIELMEAGDGHGAAEYIETIHEAFMTHNGLSR